MLHGFGRKTSVMLHGFGKSRVYRVCDWLWLALNFALLHGVRDKI